MATLIDRPCRIPRYLPSMIVRISYISSLTAVRRGVCWSDDTPARLDELLNRVLDFRLARHIVTQRTGDRRSKPGALHIFFNRRLTARAKYKAITLTPLGRATSR